MSEATPIGAATARLRRMTRPSRLVIVPSSSAHCADGSTTSAILAVSERKKSRHRQEVERREPRSAISLAAGDETRALKPITKRARTPPSVPQLWSSS